MNNNNLGRVAVRTSSRKRVSTPLDSDVNATAKIGEVMPFLCRELIPNSKLDVRTRSLIRLLPLVSPTYGKLKLNLRHYFVGLTDLSLNFSAMMAEQSVARGKYLFQPDSMPYIEKQFLSQLCLIGSHITMYRMFGSSNDTKDSSEARRYIVPIVYDGTSRAYVPNMALVGDLVQWFSSSSFGNFTPSSEPDVLAEQLADNQFYKQSMPQAWRDCWNGYDGPALNIAKLQYAGEFGGPSNNDLEFWIPIENKYWWTLFVPQVALEEGHPFPEYIDISDVKLDSGRDFVLSVRQKGGFLANGAANIAVRTSNFGQRLFNILIGCGAGFDTSDSSTTYTLMPIFAFYKAYWESFGLELYRHWESSEVYRMMHFYDDFGLSNFTRNLANSCRIKQGGTVSDPDITESFVEWFCNFVVDLGTAFYTEEQDFTSAHTKTATVTPSTTNSASSLPYEAVNAPSQGSRVNMTSPSTQSEPTEVNPTSGQPYIVGSFSQLDIETLKRLYKVVNRNTIAGQRIADLLRVQGLGAYVDSCKSRYIGEYEVPIEIDEVTATSDAYDSLGEAKTLLGEQGAKGVGFGVSKFFKTGSVREYGYYFILASVVPESGYVNQTSAHMLNKRKSDFYQPEYDGLGMELNSEELTITGVQTYADVMGDKLGTRSFGMLPRYSRHKVQTNKALGGFALPSLREDFKHYYLDKEIAVGERYVSYVTTVLPDHQGTPYNSYWVEKLVKVERLPTASPLWRYIGRYPWLEQFVRIFAYTGDSRRRLPVYFNSLDSVNGRPNLFDFVFRDSPFFIVQNRLVMRESAPWLKITDSFETKEDGNVGSTDVSIGKA